MAARWSTCGDWASRENISAGGSLKGKNECCEGAILKDFIGLAMSGEDEGLGLVRLRTLTMIMDIQDCSRETQRSRTTILPGQ